MQPNVRPGWPVAELLAVLILGAALLANPGPAQDLGSPTPPPSPSTEPELPGDLRLMGMASMPPLFADTVPASAPTPVLTETDPEPPDNNAFADLTPDATPATPSGVAGPAIGAIHDHWERMRDIFLPPAAPLTPLDRPPPMLPVDKPLHPNPLPASIATVLAAGSGVPTGSDLGTVSAGSEDEDVSGGDEDSTIIADDPTGGDGAGHIGGGSGSAAGAGRTRRGRQRLRPKLPRLTGVLISSDREHVAILDGTIVKVGDFISGFRVKKITKNSVVLKGDGDEQTLYVYR